MALGNTYIIVQCFGIMGCLAPRRVWFYLLYPCSNHPRNSFNCFFLYFERKEIYCYELYLNRRFYRIYTFNNIRILHVVLVKATPTDFQKSIGVLSLLSAYQNCLSAGATIGRPRAFEAPALRKKGVRTVLFVLLFTCLARKVRYTVGR